MVPHSDDEEDSTPWKEPETVQTLMNDYLLEAKLTGKVSGTSLYIVAAKKRDGTLSDVVDRQLYKMFLVLWHN